MRPADAHPRRVQQRWREDVLEGQDAVLMMRRRARELQIVRIGLSFRSVVGLITARERDAIREMMVDPRRAVVLEAGALSGEDVLSNIPGNRSVRQRKKCQIRPDSRI